MENILYISTYSQLKIFGGGIESWLQKFLMYSEIICKNRYNTIVVIGNYEDTADSIASKFANQNHINFLSYRTVKQNKFDIIKNYIKFTVKEISSKAKSYNIDVVYIGSLYPCLPALFIKGKNIRQFVWLRSFFPYEIDVLKIHILKPFFLLIEKKCLLKAVRIFTNGLDTTNLYEERYPFVGKKIVTIPNAVIEKDIRKNNSYLSGTKINIAYVGRFYKNKGVDAFLEAIKLFNEEKENNRINFLFIGFGAFEDSIRSYSMNHSNVIFLGKMANNEVLEYYSHIDVSVNLTYHGTKKGYGGGTGVSNSLLESLFSNNLQICWDNCTYKNVCPSNAAVYLKEGDVVGLKNIFLNLNDNPERFKVYIENAKAIRNNYTFDTHIKKFIEGVSR